MTTAEIISEIQSLESQIATLSSKAIELTRSGDDWLAQSKVGCSGIGARKQACLDDKVWKAQNAKDRYAARDAVNAQIALKKSRIASLNEEMKSIQTANINLSQNGLTSDAVATKANSEATATLMDAQARANALELNAKTASISKAESDKIENDAKRKVVFIGIAIAVVVIAIIGFWAYKKFSKKAIK